MAKLTSELTVNYSPSSDPQFNVVSLLNYCRSHVHGFPSSATPSHFSIRQFGHGQSNPTFLLEVSVDGNLKKYVMRKRPSGKLLPSAHAVDREFKVLHALGTHTKVPVPKVFCLCTDTSVIGADFYVMEYLDGRMFLDPTLLGLEAHKKNAIYRESARALASLHQIDVNAVGLGSFGRRDNYCKRQVERWGKQYMASTAGDKPVRNPKMLELISWLHDHLPSEDSSGSASGLVHGDFRIDNLVFHPKEDRVIGILDWELSTVGNQMCDVAYTCLPYIVDYGTEKAGQHKGLEETGLPEGIPSMAEYIAEYCSAARKPWPAAHWKFYIAFSLFRGAAIYAGIYNRWIMGNASGGERAILTGAKADVLVDNAWSYIAKSSVLPERLPFAICRNFLWAGSASSAKPGLVAWDFVCRPKRNGGLGFKESHSWNLALMGKYVWNLAMKADNLWVKWVSNVYIKNSNWRDYTPSSSFSWYWRKICKVKDKFRTGYNGGRWMFGKGVYSVASVYAWLRGEAAPVGWSLWVWNRLNVPKCCFIVWLIMWNRLQTRDRLGRHGLVVDTSCPVCLLGRETVDHLFVGCSFAQRCLRMLSSKLDCHSNWSSIQQLAQWLQQGVRGSFKKQVFQAHFTAMLYMIWRVRNEAVWNLCVRAPDKLVQEVLQLCHWRIASVLPKKTSQCNKDWLEWLAHRSGVMA